MLTVVIISYKEPKTIAKAIRCIADPKYSGIPKNFEVIQVSPDKETLLLGEAEAKKLKLGKKYIQIKDPKKGKPFALNLAIKKARGDIILQTDGDAYFGKGAVKTLLIPFKNPIIGGCTGHPVPINTRNNFFGYIAHLLTDSGDHRRKSQSKLADGYYISGKNFFPMSGYILCTRKIFKTIPNDVLADDAYISYLIRNKGYEIAYTQNAKVYVKFPTNFKDYFKQKVRSIGGYLQLNKYCILKRDKQSRNFFIELKYALYVLTYPKKPIEFLWSLLLFPVRLITWIKILYNVVFNKQKMPKTGWERIESTK